MRGAMTERPSEGTVKRVGLQPSIIIELIWSPYINPFRNKV